MQDTKSFGPFTIGINNRAHEFSLPKGSVRDAVNVDLSIEGRARLRTGTTLAHSASRASSLWSDNDRAFYVDAGALYEFFDDESAARIYGPVGKDVAYAAVPGRGIAFTDGTVIQRIVGNTVVPFGLATPQGSPALTALSDGSLDAGRYQVACSFQDANGEESGLSPASVVEVSGGAILVAVPQPREAAPVSVLIYVSAPNGETLYLADVVPVGVTSLVFSAPPYRGRESVTRFMSCLPPGDQLEVFRGRTYSHANGIVSYTAPYMPLGNPSRDYLQFSEPVTVMFATSYGMYFVAGQTWFLDGDPSEGKLSAISPVGGIKGTLTRLADTEEGAWFSEQGMVLTNNGQLTFLTQDNVAASVADVGAGLYREHDGLKQMVASLKNPSAQLGGARAWFSATLITEGVRDGLD